MRTIYVEFNGKFEKVNEPLRPLNANFLIQFRGMDWSGFRTLAECIAQFSELAGTRAVDSFSVVEVE